ncbi:hypothetical protein CNYM01_13983 [Colletotrichum nymphaeae SA-01]|uniref:Uncharacterized protein n=1 Tax=Colletotrichum nymphaeae SA-01 TaxID=1460502 RepID=A0A135UUV6_9PEZI|nr:hypothetical protein CNYM01_13983 [Colletotrichum nymphaeae SA-01]
MQMDELRLFEKYHLRSDTRQPYRIPRRASQDDAFTNKEVSAFRRWPDGVRKLHSVEDTDVGALGSINMKALSLCPMTVIAASRTAALIAGWPATVATALTVQYAASGSAVTVMVAGGAAALVNIALAGAAGGATSLTSLPGAAGFGAAAAVSGATSVTGIAMGFSSSLVSGATTGAVAAV